LVVIGSISSYIRYLTEGFHMTDFAATD